MPWRPRELHHATSRDIRVKRDLQCALRLWQPEVPHGTAVRPLTSGTRVAIAPHRRKPMLTKLKLAMLISAPLIAGAATYAAAQGSAPSRVFLFLLFVLFGVGG